jgi:hypothetical protein
MLPGRHQHPHRLPATDVDARPGDFRSSTSCGAPHARARECVSEFALPRPGEAVFDVIQQEPDRLREVTGIGPKRAERIIAG